MKHIKLPLLILLLSMAPFTPMVYAAPVLALTQDFRITALLSEARKAMNKGQYEAVLILANKALELEPTNQEAQHLVREAEEALHQKEEQERRAYELACATNTVNALEEFVRQYPQSDYVSDAQARISKISEWYELLQQNTITAYETYISTNPSSPYISDARTRLEQLKSEEAWMQCIQDGTENAYKLFLGTYPHSQHASEAHFQSNLLAGERLYSMSNRDEALAYLEEACKYGKLPDAAHRHMKEMQRQRTFRTLSEYSTRREIRAFVDSLPAGDPLTDRAYDLLALRLSKTFTKFSSNEDFEEALRYCRTPSTKSTVNQRIIIAKQEIAQEKKRTRKAERYRRCKDRFNFGLHLFALDLGDLGMGLHTGPSFRIGRHSDAVNFIFGVDYAHFSEIDWEGMNDVYDYGDVMSSAGNQVEIPLDLRFNMGGYFTRFTMGCAIVPGFSIGNNLRSKTLAVQPEIGMTGKHWDMMFFYRRYTNGHELLYSSEGKNSGGISLSVYF